MPQPLVVDTRLPQTDIPENDPANPRNLVRNTQMAAAQSAADTRYDPAPLKRVEGFTPNPRFTLYLLGALTLMVVIYVYTRQIERAKFSVVKIGLAIGAIFAIQRAISHMA